MKYILSLLVAGIWSFFFISATAECDDDEHYRYEDEDWKDCEWIHENNRCENHDNGHHVGKYYCPYSCHYCNDGDDNHHNGGFFHFDDDNHHNDGFFDDDHYLWCSDDKGFRYNSDYSKDCTWVADEHKCDREQNGNNIGEYYCPDSCDYCNDLDDDFHYPLCSDDKDYRYDGDYWKDCSWVAKDDRCDKEFNGKHIGKYYCPLSCNYCTQSCSDNKHYRYYGDDWKDCDWIYENNRCDAVRDGKHVGIEYCPYSCGHCNDWHEPSPTKKPTSYCHSSVDLSSYCYDDDDDHSEKIKVTFENCHPESKDWIGIYKVHNGSLGKTMEWWGNAFMWHYTCGSKACSDPEEYGTLYFENWWDDLNDGEYKTYLFDNGYNVKASSDIFEVGDCNYHPSPTKKPTSSPTKKPTSSPTKKPTSYCHSSIDVEQYCYKDHLPTNLKVTFENCHPESKDWIGIYKVHNGSLGKTMEWWGNSFMWHYTCGSKTCSDPEDDGALYFEAWWQVLNEGKYKAYLFGNDSYDVKASSEVFNVGYCY